MTVPALRGKTFQPEDLVGPLAVLTGTRPGIIKFSPIFRELDRRDLPYIMIHSGQHYSPEMDAIFFQELGLRTPHYKLDVVQHFPLHGEQTAEMLKGIERILIEERPAFLLVGGDCNTHLAGALAARKLHVPIVHVEAGMRSYDWRMPEEHNRVMIDHISEHLVVHDQSAADVLKREAVRGQIHIVGSTIADAVAGNIQIACQRTSIHNRIGIQPHKYVLATMHREENVDDPAALRGILDSLEAVANRCNSPIIVPAHPRTVRRLDEYGLDLANFGSLHVIEPQGYLDFLLLLANARLVFTDSGGVQQEAAILQVPCVTIRQSTEWVETIELGVNRLAKPDPSSMLSAVDDALSSPVETSHNLFETGAATRLVDIIAELISQHREGC